MGNVFSSRFFIFIFIRAPEQIMNEKILESFGFRKHFYFFNCEWIICLGLYIYYLIFLFFFLFFLATSSIFLNISPYLYSKFLFCSSSFSILIWSVFSFLGANNYFAFCNFLSLSFSTSSIYRILSLIIYLDTGSKVCLFIGIGFLWISDFVIYTLFYLSSLDMS